MIWLRRLLLLLPSRRRARTRELDAELQSNLAEAIDDRVERGIPAEEAARQGRRDFGNISIAREEARSIWLPGWDQLTQDLRYSLRTLRRSPGFTTVALLSLALGIGSAAAIFSIVDTVTLRPLSYRDPERLVYVREIVPPLAHIYPSLPVNINHYRFWRDHARTFDSLAAVQPGTTTITAPGDPEVVGSAVVSANLFDVLGVQPRLGRNFLLSEEQPGSATSVMITDSLWRRRFDADPAILDTPVVLDGRSAKIAGVLPPSFRFPRNDDLGPLAHLQERTEIFLPTLGGVDFGWSGDYDFIVFGRLRAGTPVSQAAADVDVLERQLSAEHKIDQPPHPLIRPLQDVMASPVRTSLGVLLAAVLLLLLIVCVNLASLLLARGSARAREYCVRVALGAPRGRMIAATVVETLLLAIAGGGLGVLVASFAVDLFVRNAPVDLPRLEEVHVDFRVALFAFALATVCGLLFGVIPALRIARVDPQDGLRAGGRSFSDGRASLRLREWLVGGEIALGTLLLVLAGLLVGSLARILQVNRGFAYDSAIYTHFDLPAATYRDPQSRLRFLDAIVERLKTVPQVTAAAAASRVPLIGESNVNTLRIAGGASPLDPETSKLIMVNARFVGPEYFSALGITRIQGRLIEPGDRNRNVAVISERLAKKAFPGESPMGKRITAGFFTQGAEVVGVVGDVHGTHLENDPTLMIYVPYWPAPQQVNALIVRGSGDTATLMNAIRSAIRAVDPAIPSPKMRTMSQIVSQSVTQRRFQMQVAIGFAGSALLLASFGVYGVVSYSVALRRREIGIRMALGATAGQVRRQVLSQGMRPVAFGIVMGLGLAMAAGVYVRSLLFNIQASDPVTLLGVSSVLAMVATAACLIPARRAAAVDPQSALRDD